MTPGAEVGSLAVTFILFHQEQNHETTDGASFLSLTMASFTRRLLRVVLCKRVNFGMGQKQIHLEGPRARVEAIETLAETRGAPQVPSFLRALM